MNKTVDIPWNRYALIAEIAKRIDEISPQFGKTALQKLVFLLQEVYKIDCGYDFNIYSYGPFDSQLLSDLDLVEHWGCVSIESVNVRPGGYRIRPTDKVDFVRDKAKDFLDAEVTKEALNKLVSIYGKMKAKDLELRATTVYIERDLKAKSKLCTKTEICRLVSQVKPKNSRKEIEDAFNELNQNRHICLES